MTVDKFARLLARAVLMTSALAVAAPTLALAQRVPKPGPGLGPVPTKTITLPCCRCLDGKSVTIKVSTGAVPWSVTPPGVGAPTVAAVAASNPAWVLPSNPAWTGAPPAVWVGAPGAIETPGTYLFQMPFHVPKCIIPMQVKISGKFAADNSGQLYVDGNLVTASAGTPSYGFLPGSVTPFTWTGTLAPGSHAIRFVVTNDDGPTGAIVAATITVTCPREAERKD